MNITTMIVLFTIVIVIWTLLILRVLKNISRNWAIHKANMARRELFRTKMKEREDMLERGERHEWIKMPIGTEEFLVCKKTGWCPSRESFIDMFNVNMQAKTLELAEKYKVYRDAEVEKLAEQYGMNLEEMEKLVESIFDIKKQFYLKKMEQAQEEMKSGGEKNS